MKKLIRWQQRGLQQQCGFEPRKGAFRPKAAFSLRNRAIPTLTATTAASNARNLSEPPTRATIIPIAYQSHPSPPRVAATIHSRSQRGGRQRFTRRMIW